MNLARRNSRGWYFKEIWLRFGSHQIRPSQAGDNFNEYVGDDDVDNYACQDTGICEVSRVHYEYLDAEKRNAKSAEWRNSVGDLRFGRVTNTKSIRPATGPTAKFGYGRPNSAERALYETDFRKLTYWQK